MSKKMLDKIKKVDDSLGNFSDRIIKKATDTPNNLKFILAIIILIIDFVIFGFNRGPKQLLAVGLMYLGLSIFNFIISSVGSAGANPRESLKVLGISLLISTLQIVIPYLALKYLALWLPQLLGLIFVIILFFSPWLVYYLFSQKAQGIVKLVKTVWLVLLVIIILAVALPTIVDSLEGASAGRELSITPDEALNDFKGVIEDRLGDFFEKVKQTTKLGDSDYNIKGEIDENKDSKLGVFIDDLRIIENKVYAGEDFNMIGTLEVNTVFNPVEIYIYCYIKANHRTGVEGEILEKVYRVFGKNKEILQCKFDGNEKGLYSGYFEALFNFETWAYIDYTFVDKELAMQYYKENRNINIELNIDEETIPVYTDGPIKILMIAANQPTEVNFEKGNLPKIGLSLENNYRKGEISKVKQIIIQTPKMLRLNNCTHEDVEEIDPGNSAPDGFIGNISDFNYYIMTNEKEKSNVLNNIVCSMEIDEHFYNTEKNINPKIIKTIIVKADYEYKVESKEKGILIEMNPDEARWER
jgi:hypothetical protein